MKLVFILLSVCSFVLDHGASGADTDKVSVKEGDSVTLYTGVETNQQEGIDWYYGQIRIAEITGDQRKICTDVQCNEGTERFRDRLKLDHQTGSLTIMNTRNTDSGEYKLFISSDSEKIFIVTVQGVSSAEREEVERKSVKEGGSVTLDTGVIIKKNDVMKWYHNVTLIAEITGDPSKICTDVQCNERFRDRLKLDHQTGSLIITNIRDTDSGVYTVKKIESSSSRRRRSINNNLKSFEVTVIASGLSSGAVAGIVLTVLLVSALAAAGVCVGVIYYRDRSSSNVVVEEDEQYALEQNAITEVEKDTYNM